MENERNLVKGFITKAHLKRKNVSQEKNANCSIGEVQTKQLCCHQRSRNTSPLCDVSSNILNLQNQPNFVLNDIYTQPRAHQILLQRKGSISHIHFHSENLLNKLVEVNENTSNAQTVNTANGPTLTIPAPTSSLRFLLSTQLNSTTSLGNDQHIEHSETFHVDSREVNNTNDKSIFNKSFF